MEVLDALEDHELRREAKQATSPYDELSGYVEHGLGVEAGGEIFGAYVQDDEFGGEILLPLSDDEFRGHVG